MVLLILQAQFNSYHLCVVFINYVTDLSQDLCLWRVLLNEYHIYFWASSQLATLITNKKEEQEWNGDLYSIFEKKYIYSGTLSSALKLSATLDHTWANLNKHLLKIKKKNKKKMSFYLHSAEADKIQFNYNFMTAFLRLESWPSIGWVLANLK